MVTGKIRVRQNAETGKIVVSEVMQGADLVRFDFFILTFLIAGLYSLFCAFSFVAGGVGGHALFFSAGLLQQMSHSHVPIKNKRPSFFARLNF